MLAGLYIGYVIVLAKWRPDLMPPLSESERRVPLPPRLLPLTRYGSHALAGLWRALTARSSDGTVKRTAFSNLLVSVVPVLAIVAILDITYRWVTTPDVEASTAGLVQAGGDVAADVKEDTTGGLQEPEEEKTEGQEKPVEGLKTPPAADTEPAKPETTTAPPASAGQPADKVAGAAAADAAAGERLPMPQWFWILIAVAIGAIGLIYWLWNWERLEVFKMLLTSFFPLALLILAVLGSIVVGLATPSEAAAVGGFGGLILAAVYRFLDHWRQAKSRGSGRGAVTWTTMKDLGVILKESSFLTAKTSAMVCWLFVGSGIFSAAFALLGGQELIEKWVLSLEMTPLQFMILAQFITFLLGWPLEWTEIIIIFMPIFIPLLPHFHIDPLFFGLLVALNLQTAFLSPPVAMAAFYLKGVSPPHVTLNQIFAGMMPFMGIQVVALILLYMFPGIGLWLPSVLYK